MGTNYYVELNACPCCKRGTETLHIGKSSGGWQFNFAPYEEHGLTSWKAWREFLSDKEIRDEYGRTCSLADFEEMVEAKQDGYNFRTAPASMWGPGARMGSIDEDGYQFSHTAEFF